jgi:hypothetical protein
MKFALLATTIASSLAYSAVMNKPYSAVMNKTLDDNKCNFPRGFTFPRKWEPSQGDFTVVEIYGLTSGDTCKFHLKTQSHDEDKVAFEVGRGIDSGADPCKTFLFGVSYFGSIEGDDDMHDNGDITLNTDGGTTPSALCIRATCKNWVAMCDVTFEVTAPESP